jgi:D-alanyl-D-alanine carboxypeptidase
VIEGGLLKRWRPEELVTIAREHQPYFAPGAGFHYSNTNYVVLGLVIERVTGRPLARELERRLLRPLGLRDTSYDTSIRVPGLAPGPRQSTSWAGASGALVSTARDLARFYRALLTGRVLAAPQLAAMKTGDPYGLGLYRVPTGCGEAWGHNGALPGYFSNAFSSDDGSHAGVVLVTANPLSERQFEAANRALAEALC